MGDLSREDQQPLKEKDLTKGSNLVVTVNSTDYPVSFVDFAGPGLSLRVPVRPSTSKICCQCFYTSNVSPHSDRNVSAVLKLVDTY